MATIGGHGLRGLADGLHDRRANHTTRREYVGQGGQYVFSEAVETTETDLAETLAQAKRAYNDTLIARIRDGRWSNTRFCIDAVLAALAAAGDDADTRACRVAAGTPAVLDDCPRCYSELRAKNGARLCEDCGWHEEHSRLTTEHSTPARIDADIAAGADGVHGVSIRRLPPTAELPDPSAVLVPDATPRIRELAALFGTDPDTVTVEGNDAYALPHATITQFSDGAYHRSTLESSETAQQRIQHRRTNQ